MTKPIHIMNNMITNSELEHGHLFECLEQLQSLEQVFSHQFGFVPHIELVEIAPPLITIFQ